MATALAAARKPVAVNAAALPALQRKLEVGGASDHFEREADQVARRVVQGGAPAPIPPTITPLPAQRKAMSAARRKAPKEVQKGTVQRKANGKTPKVEEEKKSSGNAQRKAATSPPKKEDEKAAGAKLQRKAATSPKPAKAPEAKKAGGKAVQRKAAPSPNKEEEKPAKGKAQRKVQRDDGGAGAAGGVAPTSVESSISQMQSTGSGGLDGNTRSFMESRMGHDFGSVRVHRGSDAAAAANALNARAFTVGNDIFFNRGEYQPHSHRGRELLAHELTHTVQQSGSSSIAARKRIQRQGGSGPPAATPPAAGEPAPDAAATLFPSTRVRGASINITSPGENMKGTITMPTLGLPPIANTLKGSETDLVKPRAAPGFSLPVEGSPFVRNPVGERGDERAYVTWNTYAAANFATSMKGALDRKVQDTPNKASIQEGGQQVVYLTFAGERGGRSNYIFIGSTDELSRNENLLRPQWSPTGSPGARLDADHIMELQIGGLDSAENMWLLQSDYNRTVGSTLKTRMDNDLKDLLRDQAMLNRIADPAKRPVDPTEIKRNWVIRYNRVERANFGTTTTIYWTREQITNGEHLRHLRVMSEDDLVRAGVQLRPGQRPEAIRIFPSAAGGQMVSVPIDAQNNVRVSERQFFYRGIFINSGTYLNTPLDTPGPLMDLNVTVFKSRGRGKKKIIEERTANVQVTRLPRLGIAGYISPDAIRAAAGSTTFTPLSPLTFSDLAVGPEGMLTGTGSVATTKPLLPGLVAPLQLIGDEIRMNLPIPNANFSLGPVNVSELGLGIGVREDNLFLEGYALFDIAGLGRGSVRAGLEGTNPILAGDFHFDMDFFNPASIGVRYNFATDEFTATGTLGVERGRVPGVESGSVTVTITRDNVDVTGTVTLAAPLAGTLINVGYTRESGVSIRADNIPLPFANLPAVQNATMSIGAARSPEGVWSFTGSGTATLAVPGATGTINLNYVDGLVTMTTVATVQKGPATGTLNFTASNSAIDEQGNPIEGQIGNGITTWGRGRVTIQFGQFVTGTADIEYTRDNAIILRGEIGLPPVYEVFARREYNRELLHLEPPEFPIWGVSVAGIGIGIFAFVDARVSFNAYVGPGQIRDAAIGAEMDLDHPENATINGHGQFYVPAYAGLNLDVGGGLRARAAVAYAQGRVGLEGQLGIEADASASVDLNWNRTDGVSLETTFEANARPKFRLLANASITVGVDLFFTDVSHTFGPWERTLGEFGPDVELGVSFPVRWSEANGLDLSLDNMTVRQPTLDAGSLMSSVFDRLAS